MAIPERVVVEHMHQSFSPADNPLDLHGEAFQRDPHATLREVRARGWVAQTALGPAVLSYDEVATILGSRDFRTPGADFLRLQGITEGSLVTAMEGFLLNTDGAAHDRVRRLVARAFTGPRVAAYRPTLRALAEAMAGSLVTRGTFDFMADFADPYARAALCGFIGIPEEAHAHVHQWTSDLALIFGMEVENHRPRIERALAGLDACIDELLSARRAQPKDDLLTALIAARDGDDRLSDAELRSLVMSLMSAGHHTTMVQLGNAIVAFREHPEQWQRLQGDLGLLASATEEVVRYSPAALLGIPRLAKVDVEIRGVRFAAGTVVIPLTGAANRDPSAFEAPDEFDISRTRSRTIMTYGVGIHHCLGVALARAEIQEALGALARALAELSSRLGSRAELTEAGEATWLPPTEAVYGPLTLPMRAGV